MSFSEKNKTIDNKIEQYKAQFDLDRKTALSPEHISKYEFLTGKDVLPEKDLLQKTATTKTFECSPLDKELKA